MSNNRAFVGSIPENYDRYLGRVLFDPYAADLAARLHVSPDAAVLELACGTGIVTRRLRDRLGPGARLVATDLNEAMLDFARKKFRAEEKVEWKKVDATELSFADQAFDAVVCQFGVMFFPDKEKAIREVYRVLKPSGTLLFNVWDAIELNDLPHIAHTIIAKFFADNPPDFYQVPFSFYDRETIRTLLTAAGFRDIQLSEVALPATSPSVQELTRGLVHGNPVITAIRERDEASISAIEAEIAAAITAQFGSAPVRAKMSAVVCAAIR
jgi:ubiquinone/menaquinone biosynthesis C-methylase UbiE